VVAAAPKISEGSSSHPSWASFGPHVAFKMTS